MTDPQSWVAPTLNGLADLLEAAPAATWDAASLCANWQVRHVVAHLGMPVRLTPEQFGAEMAAANGDFTTLSNTVAERDAFQPVEEHLAQLRSPLLHEWQAPGGGAAGALMHAVIHSLDITLALDEQPIAPGQAVLSVLDQLTTENGDIFGIDLTNVRLVATDAAWEAGIGDAVRADAGALVALLSGRTLPDGRKLPRS